MGEVPEDYSIMRGIIIGGVVAAITALAAAAPVQAHSWRPDCSRALIRSANHHRHIVVKRSGQRAAGRNIVKWGVIGRNQHPHRASCHTVRKYRNQLIVLHTVPKHTVGLARTASLPYTPPAGAMTPTVAATGQAACIVSRESGGNPQAVNGQYKGIAQWSPEAWARMGGTRYAPTPLGASYQEQLNVLGSGLAKYGSGDWSPYDGC